MKGHGTFYRKLILFLAPLALLSWAMDQLLESHPNLVRQLSIDLREKGPGSEIAVIGSSHGYSLMPDSFSVPVVNLSNPNQSLPLGAAILERYLPTLKKLKTVVVTVSYFTLKFRLPHTTEEWRSFHYRRYLGVWGESGIEQALDIRGLSLFLLYGPSEVSRWLLEPKGPVSQPALPLAAEPTASLDSMVAFQNAMIREENYPKNTAVLNRLLDRLGSQGIRTLLFTVPGNRAYRSATDPKHWADTRRTLSEIAQSRPGLVKYVDWLDDPRFSDADFRDHHHLNFQASDRLVHYLEQDVLKPWSSPDSSPSRDLSRTPH